MAKNSQAEFTISLPRFCKAVAGFTLLEILVVLTIMGFLVAMVVPQLAGVSSGAVDTIGKENQNRTMIYLGRYLEKNSRFPDRLTNLVISDGVNTDLTLNNYQIPVVSDGDPHNGAEVLAFDLNERYHLHIHILTLAEAAELKNMGIVTLLNLNNYTGLVDAVANPTDYSNDIPHVAIIDEVEAMAAVKVTEGLGVAMIGMGGDGATSPVWTASNIRETSWGKADLFGRIVLGLGMESSLVSEGMVYRSATSPDGIRNRNNQSYNDYLLVLPRLTSTVNSYDATVTAMDGDTNSEGVQLRAVAYVEGLTVPYNYISNADNLRYRVRTLRDQEIWEYAVLSPKGDLLTEEGRLWGVDLNANLRID